MPEVCPRCFAARRVQAAIGYRLTHQLDRGDAEDVAGVQRRAWASLARELQQSFEALEGADVAVCAMHAAASVPLYDRALLWAASRIALGWTRVGGVVVNVLSQLVRYHEDRYDL